MPTISHCQCSWKVYSFSVCKHKSVNSIKKYAQGDDFEWYWKMINLDFKLFSVKSVIQMSDGQLLTKESSHVTKVTEA